MKNSIRNQAIDLLKSQTVPFPTSKLIHRMICLPNLYEIQNYKRLNIEGDISLSLLGKKKIMRNLSIDEQSFVETALLQENNIGSGEISRMVEMIENTAIYPRICFRSGSNSTFTTSAYVRSKKRINYCALLKDGRFFS